MSFIKNARSKINKPYAIRLEEAFFTEPTPAQRLVGQHLIIDLRNIAEVFVSIDGDELNHRIWTIKFKNGDELDFYPIFHNNREGTFLNNSYEIFTSYKQRLKAFRYLFSRLAKWEKNYLMLFDDIKLEMNSPHFFATEFERET
jgi:hypothetical protein